MNGMETYRICKRPKAQHQKWKVIGSGAYCEFGQRRESLNKQKLCNIVRMDTVMFTK